MSDLWLIGCSHKTAPVEEREKVAVPEDQTGRLLLDLIKAPRVREAVVLNTCNRFEVVVAADGPGDAIASLQHYLGELRGVPRQWFDRFGYAHHNGHAIEHVFRVSSSLESLVLGEPQILGQVKKSWMLAQETGTTGPLLNRLFNHALHVGKRVRTETGIAENAVSISYAGVELARKVFEDLRGCSVLVIGAGKMGALAAQHLRQAGATRLHILNRSIDRARELAATLQGEAHGMEELEDMLAKVDIVLSSTGSQHYVIRQDLAKRAVARRKYRPLFLIDIAVPRDIDPRCESLPNTWLFDIDDLQQVVEANRANRRTEAALAQDIVQRETEAMLAWMSSTHVVPTIVSLRTKLTRLKDEELERMRRAHPEMSPEMVAAAERMAHALINKVLHEPTTTLKKASATEHHPMLVAAARSLFGLREDAVSDAHLAVASAPPLTTPGSE